VVAARPARGCRAPNTGTLPCWELDYSRIHYGSGLLPDGAPVSRRRSNALNYEPSHGPKPARDSYSIEQRRKLLEACNADHHRAAISSEESGARIGMVANMYLYESGGGYLRDAGGVTRPQAPGWAGTVMDGHQALYAERAAAAATISRAKKVKSALAAELQRRAAAVVAAVPALSS